jgi:hypothetical protein
LNSFNTYADRHIRVVNAAVTFRLLQVGGFAENEAVVCGEFTSSGNSNYVSLTYVITIYSRRSDLEIMSIVSSGLEQLRFNSDLRDKAHDNQAPRLESASFSSFSIACVENCSPSLNPPVDPPSSSSSSSSKLSQATLIIIAVVVPCGMVLLILLMYFLFWLRQSPPEILVLSPASAPPIAYCRLSTNAVSPSVYPTIVGSELEMVDRQTSGNSEISYYPATGGTDTRLTPTKGHYAVAEQKTGGYAVVGGSTDLKV